jgi:osomolarity two-component system response regulator SSK1
MGLNPAAGGLSHSNATFSGHPSLAAARQQDYDLMNGVHNIGTVGVDDHFKHVANTVRNITLEDGRVPMIPGLPPPGPSPSTATTTRHTAKKSKKQMMMDAMEALPSTGVGHVVPPINVLIVEDNPINLKLLEAFVKKLKVRWKTAVNGQEAVSKWRQGGFHLVLMDIQLPVMNGLDATREIRRLERVNSIGIFTTPASGVVGSQTRQLLLLPGQVSEDDKPVEQDKLEKPEQFKSPVIIVALTASSLQSDRHEALAAGCNDFLTKVRACGYCASTRRLYQSSC